MHVKILGVAVWCVFFLLYTMYSHICIPQPPQPEIIEVFEEDLSKTPEPKPWISLGSELEIDEESVKETREKALQHIQINVKYLYLITFLCSSILLIPLCSLVIISCVTSSRKCGGCLRCQPAFLTATLQMLRIATWSVLPTKTADSASSRCRGTAGYRLFPGCRAAVLRRSGMPANQHT